MRKAMAVKPGEMFTQNVMKVSNESAMRASISFPPDLYRSLEELAKQKKVSLAWIVRDAAEHYLADHKRKNNQS